jgi:hypothetical protein
MNSKEFRLFCPEHIISRCLTKKTTDRHVHCNRFNVNAKKRREKPVPIATPSPDQSAAGQNRETAPAQTGQQSGKIHFL